MKMVLQFETVYFNQNLGINLTTESAWPIKMKRNSGNQEMVKCKDLARMPGVRKARNPSPLHSVSY